MQILWRLSGIQMHHFLCLVINILQQHMSSVDGTNLEKKPFEVLSVTATMWGNKCPFFPKNGSTTVHWRCRCVKCLIVSPLASPHLWSRPWHILMIMRKILTFSWQQLKGEWWVCKCYRIWVPILKCLSSFVGAKPQSLSSFSSLSCDESNRCHPDKLRFAWLTLAELNYLWLPPPRDNWRII